MNLMEDHNRPKPIYAQITCLYAVFDLSGSSHVQFKNKGCLALFYTPELPSLQVIIKLLNRFVLCIACNLNYYPNGNIT